MNKRIFSIAIDGPCGAGKSSVSSQVAKALQIVHLDTGAMYRAVGLYMVRNGVDVSDAEAVAERVDEVEITVQYTENGQQTFLMGEDVTGLIRTAEMSAAASLVSKVPRVRERMVHLQREIARGIPLVMDGRDAGTCVLPEATLKIYLTADVKVRAERRYKELLAKDPAADYEQVLNDCIQRDINDTTREVSPLTKAEDAVELDSTGLTQAEVVLKILALLREKTEV